MMNEIIPEKRAAEIDWWRGYLASLGVDRFMRVRFDDWKWKTRFFPELREEEGRGLDLACGLVSIFEFSGLKNVVAADALMDEYQQLLPRDGAAGVEYRREDGEDLTFETRSFDYVFCCNAIDHTPNPLRMLQEIERVLKPGGRLYFQVNYDPALYAPHYQIWRRETVDAHMKASHFGMRLAVEEWWEEHHKYLFWGKYVV